MTGNNLGSLTDHRVYRFIGIVKMFEYIIHINQAVTRYLI